MSDSHRLQDLHQLREDRLRMLARRTLHRAPPGTWYDGPGDDDLNPGFGGGPDDSDLKPAAVLVPIVTRGDERPLSVILTVRTAHLNSHAGQIAFPGGKVDAGETIEQTALREAREEIGLSAALVEPLGYLDWYRTRTGFAVCPLVALIKPGFRLKANPGEVEDVFEVPLEFLLDETNHHKHARHWQGKERLFYAMPYGERYIWGATAGMIRNMHKRLTNG